jgi:hypothetical protein
LQPDFNPVAAEIALGCGIGIGIDIERIVGTGLHACFTADADIRIEIDNAIVALVQRRHRTDRYTRRVLAMVTAQHGKIALRIGEFPLLHVFDPGAVHPEWHLMFFLTRHTAGVATDAFAVVNEKTEFHVSSTCVQACKALAIP